MSIRSVIVLLFAVLALAAWPLSHVRKVLEVTPESDLDRPLWDPSQSKGSDEAVLIIRVRSGNDEKEDLMGYRISSGDSMLDAEVLVERMQITRTYESNGSYTDRFTVNRAFRPCDAEEQFWNQLEALSIASARVKIHHHYARDWSAKDMSKDVIEFDFHRSGTIYLMEVAAITQTKPDEDAPRSELGSLVTQLLEEYEIGPPTRQLLSLYEPSEEYRNLTIALDHEIENINLYGMCNVTALTRDEDQIEVKFDGDLHLPLTLKGCVVEDRAKGHGIYSDFGFGFLFPEISTNIYVRSREGIGVTPPTVTVAELLADPVRWHGRRVRLECFFTPKFEGMEVHDRGSRGSGLWLNFPEDLEEAERWGGNVTIDGNFYFGWTGHMGMSIGEISYVSRVEKVAPIWEWLW